MKDYLSPKIEVLDLYLEQAIMTSSTSEDAQREDYDVFDLFV